eukprot:1805409-Rhodomonas_salina.1
MCDDTCSSDGDCLATGAQQTETKVGYLFLSGDRVGWVSSGTPCSACHSGTLYSVSTGSPDSALQFSGKALNVQSAYTLMIWMKMSTASDNLQVFSIAQGVRTALLYKTAGKLAVQTYTDTPTNNFAFLGSPNNFPFNAWLHVALVVNVNAYGASMYENGVVSDVAGGEHYPPFTTGVDVKFMVNSGGGSSGTVSDAILHSRVFSAAEIDAVYSGRWFDTSSALGIGFFQASHTFDLYACACNAGYSGSGV